MALEKITKLLEIARTNGYALGYFEAWDTYSFEAVLEAAEEEQSPVILGFGGVKMQQQWFQRFGIAPLGAYGRAMAEKAKVPVALILNEVLELEHIAIGVKSGYYNVVMLDSCSLPLENNIQITQKVVELAHPAGIEVQAELGRLPDFGQSPEGVLTDPEEAAEFVEATQVDLLAVSIGNVHLQTEGSARIDLERLQRIRQKVKVPLVIHGGSGFPPDTISKVIQSGVSLFHFGTLMKKTFFEETEKQMKSLVTNKPDYQTLVGSRKNGDILINARQAVKNLVKHYMRLYGSSGKAGIAP